jgi:hypothetical protein
MLFSKIIKFYGLLLLLFLPLAFLFAQNQNVSSELLWILILPGAISESEDQAMENDITDRVVDIAWELGRFEVFDRYDVRDLLLKYHKAPYGSLPDSVVLTIGEEIKCDEALIIDILSFSQIGVPPEEDEEKEDRNFVESIFDGLFSSDSEDYSDNIHTRLTVQFRNIDLISGEEIDRFKVRVSHTGGTKPESKEEVLENFGDVVSNEVRMIYQLVSEVIDVDGVDLNLHLSSNVGITRNTLFEIIEPNQIKTEGEEEITSPGKSAGLVCVQSASDTVNQSLIIRQWRAIEPGYYANEFNKNIHGIQLFFLPKFPGDYMYIGGQFHSNPLGAWDFGGGMHYTSVTDSYNEVDHGLGFSVFGARRIYTLTALMLYAKLGTNLDIPFKDDDDGQSVTSVVLSVSLGISCNLMFTKKSDIEINFGYRLSAKSSDWSYSEEEQRYDAFWLEEVPVIDLSGFYFTVGYKFILF